MTRGGRRTRWTVELESRLLGADAHKLLARALKCLGRAYGLRCTHAALAHSDALHEAPATPDSDTRTL